MPNSTRKYSHEGEGYRQYFIDGRHRGYDKKAVKRGKEESWPLIVALPASQPALK